MRNMREDDKVPRSHTEPPLRKKRVYRPFAHMGETPAERLARVRKRQLEYNKTFHQRQKKNAITVTFK